VSQTLTNERIQVGVATLSIEMCGTGETVVLLPSWARSAQDFADLIAALAASGFRAIAVNPRGIGGSTGPLTGITLHDFAADVAGLLETLNAAPAHIVGHAGGNRIARCLATDRPDLVKTVILLAAGGRVAPQREAFAALECTLTAPLADAEWLAAIRTSRFFAPSSDPLVWRQGWWPAVAAAHLAAGHATPHGEWWAAGNAPLLVIQGLDDGLAPPANGRALREEFGGRVRLIELSNAGHALLPEQPEAIAQAVLAFLREHQS
jgi:pimeloyl-ACP methyl ester carboxylesterase